jgi:hypothetical protein
MTGTDSKVFGKENKGLVRCAHYDIASWITGGALVLIGSIAVFFRFIGS